MTTCAVKWCGKSTRTSNCKNDGITFHRFPQCPKRKKKWIDATCRGEEWFPSQHSKICSRHFEADAFHIMKDRRRLMDSAFPTLYLPILIEGPSTPAPPRENQHESEETDESSCEELHNHMPLAVQDPTSTSINTPSRKKHSRADNSTSAYHSLIKKRLCRRILELKNTVQSKNRQLRKLRDSKRRLKRKIVSLKSLLAEQEKKS